MNLENWSDATNDRGVVREGDARFRSLIRNAPDVITVLDREGAIVYESPSLERVLGYPPEERIGTRGSEYVHPEDREVAGATFAEALSRPGIGLPVRFRLRHKDGRWRHVEATRTNLLDDPAVGGVVINYHDVTDRVEAERKLRESEERYRSLMHQSVEAIYLYDLETRRVLESNAAFQELIGYGPEELLGCQVYDFIAHDREDIDESIRRSLRERRRHVGETNYLHKDGSLLTVETSASVISHEGGTAICAVARDVTELRSAQEELRESEERYRRLVEISPEPILVHSEGVYVYANAAAARLLGVEEPEELIGRSYLDFLDPDYEEVVKARVAQAEGEGRQADLLEMRLIRLDGHSVCVESLALPITYRGKPATQALIRDITERKRAEEALKESEERFRSIFENTALGISIADTSRKITQTNRAYQEMVGYSAEELRGKPIAELSHPDDVANDEEWTWQLLSDDIDCYQTEKRYIRKDGRTIWVRVTISAARNAEGKVSFLVGMVEDITERKGTEEKLLEAEERFRTLVEMVPAIVYRQDAETRATLYDSPQIESVLGYPADICERDPHYWDKIVHPEDLERVRSAETRAAESGEYRLEYRCIARDGRVVWFRDEATLLRGGKDGPRIWQGVLLDITERKRAEETLKESEKKFRSVVQNSSEIVKIVELDGTLKYASPALERVLGYDPEEALGMNVLDYVHPDDLPRVLEETERTSGEPGVGRSVLEYRFRHADGSWRHMESVGTHLLDEPSIRGVVINARDVTERKRNAEALYESEQRFKGAFENASTGVALVSLDGRYVKVNSALLQMLGYPEEELLAKTSSEIIHPDDLEKSRDRTRRLLAHGGPEKEILEKRYVHRDGTSVWVLSSVSLVRDPDGNPSHFVSHFQDVTGRKEIEGALRKSEERFRSLVQNASDIITLVTSEGIVRYVSPAIQRVLGYTPEERIGESTFGLLRPDDVVRARELFQESMEKPGTLVSSEIRMRHRDGSWRCMEATGVSLLDDPSVGSVVLNTRDITERKLAEEALRDSEKLYRRQSQELSLLYQLSTELAQELDLPAVFRTVVEAIALNFGYTQVSTYLLEDGVLSLQHQVGYDHIIEKIPTSRGISGRVARTGHSVFLEDVREDPEFLGAIDGITSEICAPLFSQGRVVGTLNVETVGGVRLTEADVRLTNALADQVSIAIGRARLHAQVRDSEAKYRSVVENVKEIIFQTDERGRWTFLNPAWREVTGFSVEDSLLRDHRSFIHLEDPKLNLSAQRSHAASGDGTVGRHEARILTRDGGYRWVEVNYMISTDERGAATGSSGVLNDVTERKILVERLAYQALHDPLTGLANRRLFTDNLRQALARSKRQNSRVAVMFLDLDNFKDINDSLGHEAGDQLLVGCAERLRSCLRPEDTVARLGGDEFVILLENSGLGAVVWVAERILASLGAPFNGGRQEVFVTTSIGVALGDHTHEAEALLRNADLAMYRAKENGRANYEVFGHEMGDGAVSRLISPADLRRALERDELKLYYQPLVRLRTGEITGLEAFLRWEHPKRGLLNPAEFLPLADETEFIQHMGKWVLSEVCRQFVEWRRRGAIAANLEVCVNLSPGLLRHPRMVEIVAEVLKETGLEPVALCLEVAESATVDAASNGAASNGAASNGATTLRRLKRLGVRTALDDFGAGYSSLSSLKQTPVDRLKIGRSFINGLPHDKESTAIVSTVTGLAQALASDVVAMGVESIEQLEKLKEIGCQTAQGHYFSRPLPREEVPKLLETGSIPGYSSPR